MSKLVEDTRPIVSVCEGDAWWVVGQCDITKIEAYDETGQMSYVPWLAVWKGDVLVTRMDAAGKVVSYG